MRRREDEQRERRLAVQRRASEGIDAREIVNEQQQLAQWRVKGGASENHKVARTTSEAASHEQNSGETVGSNEALMARALVEEQNLEVETPLNVLNFKDSIVDEHPVRLWLLLEFYRSVAQVCR
ncbi:hypothetical protein Scep_003725 [Stephania cephalantha]|uniref:Uncharacterized protein n=1 Tax=Stephania cephalantha TaxID=152367 RepID=A0AAP0PYB8_9MAGN